MLVTGYLPVTSYSTGRKNGYLFYHLKKNNMNILQRVSMPTPGFFKTLRNIGLTLAAVSTVVITAPVSLPVIITTMAGYLAVAGGVMSAVSQVATIVDGSAAAGSLPAADKPASVESQPPVGDSLPD
jgi:hypothetical protein